ncbi:MAG TPA: hypothetical protein VFO83_04640, partial [Aggregicoccus sp.]|nr:hypothetical protein [Aggregicoccus sp.]
RPRPPRTWPSCSRTAAAAPAPRPRRRPRQRSRGGAIPPERGQPLSLPRLLSLAALGLAVAALGYRLANLDLAPFILDEPQFLAAATEQLRTGRWLRASPLVGTQGVTYGPSVLWFYGAVHALLGPSPERSILAMCLLVTASHLALALALARLLRGGVLLAALLVGLLAASPYQFFWSRLAWDQLVNVCAAWALVLLATQAPLGAARSLALGLVLGVAVSSHLMVLPLVALVLAGLAWELRTEPRRLLRTLALLAAGLLAVNLPYLGYLAAHPPPALPPPRGSLQLLGVHLLQPARVATLWGIDYFFDGDWGRFLAGSALARTLHAASLPLLAALLLASAAGLGVALRSSERGTRRVALLAVLTWLGYGAFYALRGLEPQPHYQFPTGWVLPFGLAAGVQALRGYRPRLGGLAVGALAALACVQLAFIGGWMHFIREGGGTRGVHYATPLALQQQALAAACSASSGPLLLQNETRLFAPSLQYAAWSLPACAGRQVGLCAGRCPRGLLYRRLRYASATGGALAVE